MDAACSLTPAQAPAVAVEGYCQVAVPFFGFVPPRVGIR